MALPATEIAFVPLRDDVVIGDVDSLKVSEAWKAFLLVVSAQEGFQRCYFGQRVESPRMLDLFIDWDSIEAHENFKASHIYQAFVKQFLSMTSGPVTIYHVHFTPYPPSAAISSTTSSITQIIIAYFFMKSATYADIISHVLDEIKSKADGCTGASGEWIVEKVENTQILGHGVKAHAYVACIGWQCKEHQMAFQTTKKWQNLLVSMEEGPVKLVEHHTKLREAGKENALESVRIRQDA